MEDKQSFFEIFKENKEIIILIPTLLGGLYQILNLLTLVGLPYVRYFSVSQVIPDGLLISITLICFYLLFKLIVHTYIKLNIQDNSASDSLIINIFYILFFLSVGFYFLFIFLSEEDYSSLAIILLRYLTLALSSFLIWAGIKRFLIISGLYILSLMMLRKMDNEVKESSSTLLILFLLIVFFKVVPNEISVINSSFIRVSNFENYPIFIKKVKSDFHLKHEPTLLYINKDYAFFKLDDNSNILVVDSKGITEPQK